jgi:uncharacterized membrane protein YuzA (DUF378 family)
MRKLALKVATMGFFSLAMVGWVCGLSPLTCGLRALVGAAALFVLAKLAGRLAAAILADGIARSMSAEEAKGAER